MVRREPRRDVKLSSGIWVIAWMAAISLTMLSCSKGREAKAAPELPRPLGQPLRIEIPLGLPELPVPANNPPTVETVALGRKLYYDVILSRNNTLSCATCHNPALRFTDGQRVSKGFGGKLGTRNALTILNSAYNPTEFWDGRAASLEEQAAGPMANPSEMDQPHSVSLAKLNAIPAYRQEFEKAFGPGPITLENVQRALASFERTLLSGNSPFDQYEYGGNKKALSPAAIRGLAIFRDPNKGNCAACHTIGDKYALFTDDKFHNIGIGIDSNGELTDLGRYTFTKAERDKGAFRTPTLRNVAMTAPYMHDGSEKTLRDVVDYYVGGGNSNPYLDKEIHPLDLSAQDRADLVEFLKSLTGTVPGSIQ